MFEGAFPIVPSLQGIGLHVLADNNGQALEGHGNGVVRWFHCLNAGHDDHWVKVTSHSHGTSVAASSLFSSTTAAVPGTAVNV